jgi:hypothetical protein
MKRKLYAAVGLVCAITLLAVLSTKPTFAQGVLKPLQALIVNDTSQPVNVRDVNNERREPVSLTAFISLRAGSSDDGTFLFTVPEGKRLVLEDAGASVAVPNGQRASVGLLKFGAVDGGGALGARKLTVTYQMTTTVDTETESLVTDILEAGESVRMYFEPGERVYVNFLRSGAAGNATANLMVSGYLVNVAQ